MTTYLPASAPMTTDGRPPKIVVERLSKTFMARGARVEALRDVNLVVPERK